MNRAVFAGCMILQGVGVAAPGLADGPAAAPAEGTRAAAASAYSNQLICRREYQIGSNIKRSVCRTQAQIDRERAAAKEISQEVRRRSGINIPKGP